jgi:hypothetical protein
LKKIKLGSLFLHGLRSDPFISETILRTIR